MKICKRHPSESGPGVCPICLSDRLLAVLAEQQESPFHDPPRISDVFPSPATPGSSGRRSVDARFFRTPPPQPDARRHAAGYGDQKPSLLDFLFGRPRSKGSGADPADPKVSNMSSWFRALIPGRRRRRRMKMATEESLPPQPSAARIACRASDRGMSPAAEEDGDDTATESGYSTETSSVWSRAMPTPIRATPSSNHHSHYRHHHHHHHRGPAAGFTMCLTPLVNAAAPSIRRRRAAECSFSGEINHHHHRCRRSKCGGESFGPARSRKAADFGKFL